MESQNASLLLMHLSEYVSLLCEFMENIILVEFLFHKHSTLCDRCALQEILLHLIGKN